MIPEYMAEMFKTFDGLGEADVRAKLYNNTWSYDPRMLGAASEWVRLKDQAVTLGASGKRDAREEETLEIARASNAIAEAANRLALSASTDARLAREAAERQAFWAMTAAVTAITALIVAIAAITYAKP